jgi:hypothetical protein
LLIQKSKAKTIVVDSKIDSVNYLATKTVSLLIQKSAAKSCVAANSEIGSDGGVISCFTLTLLLCLHPATTSFCQQLYG